MSEPFLGEIRIFGFNFAPRHWATCDGQILPINQNQALYSLLGTTYGGDGRTSFALPDLRSRTPVDFGSAEGNYTLGQKSGEETHTLTTAELPSHTHLPNSSSATGDLPAPANNVWALASAQPYTSSAATDNMNAAAISNTGGGQAHENMAPYLVLNICIALQGIFPSRN